MRLSFSMKMKPINKGAIIALLIIAANLIYHQGIMVGRVRELADKSCVDPMVLRKWEHTMELAEAICVDVQQNQLDSIKKGSDEKIKMAEEKTEQWKKSYFWCEDRIKKLNTNNYENSN